MGKVRTTSRGQRSNHRMEHRRQGNSSLDALQLIESPVKYHRVTASPRGDFIDFDGITTHTHHLARPQETTGEEKKEQRDCETDEVNKLIR